MILSALVDYYRRQEAAGEIAPFGFSREGIHFAVVLNPDGSLKSLDDIQETVITNAKTGKSKQVPTSIRLPDRGGRSGTKIFPNFMWDNTGYALGRDGKGKPERAEKMFAAFRELHLSLADQIDDADYQVVCEFLKRWNPADAEKIDNWDEACGLNVVFRVWRDGQRKYAHESEVVQAAWLNFLKEDAEAVVGTSLLTGQEEPLARLHPLLQGVVGANTMGAAIVSFNASAYESYGKEQSFNAPVGEQDAFRYTTALNQLLRDEHHRIRIGDATVVFWSEQPTPFELLFGEVLAEPGGEDEALLAEVKGFFNALRRGDPHGGLAEPETKFYVLGLSPNASRLSIRFWLEGTVGEFADRLRQHAEDLEMIGARETDPPIVIRRLLLETAREPKEIAPQLAGQVAAAVLGGGRYPESLYTSVIRRIRIERHVNHRRAAILKACLVRKHRVTKTVNAKEIPVSLNVDHPDPAYHLGRLFAALEKTQEDAGQTNKTIRDGYYGSASAMPASVFPKIIRMHQYHLNKLENKGQRVNRERLVQEICAHIEERFPSHLSLEDQGLFHIGYYHQRQDFFKKRETAPEAEEIEA